MVNGYHHGTFQLILSDHALLKAQDLARASFLAVARLRHAPPEARHSALAHPKRFRRPGGVSQASQRSFELAGMKHRYPVTTATMRLPPPTLTFSRTSDVAEPGAIPGLNAPAKPAPGKEASEAEHFRNSAN
uniref:Uncharacterized protein n=1 Tax=Sphaerodactylus townsendi TaxID=933632 RepID=A0ACB8ET94_9SAUR